MIITINLDDKMNKDVEDYCKLIKINKSEFFRRSIKRFFDTERKRE